MGSIIGHRIDYNGVGALRGQRHIPSKKCTQVPPRASCALAASPSSRTSTIESARRVKFNLSSYHVWFDVHVQVAFCLVACFRVRFNSLHIIWTPRSTIWTPGAGYLFRGSGSQFIKLFSVSLFASDFSLQTQNWTHLLNTATVHYRLNSVTEASSFGMSIHVSARNFVPIIFYPFRLSACSTPSKRYGAYKFSCLVFLKIPCCNCESSSTDAFECFRRGNTFTVTIKFGYWICHFIYPGFNSFL